MTPHDLAARLNVRTIGNELTPEEEKLAADNGLVVLFGASDDLAEFRGAIHGEADCYDGGNLYIVDGKLYEDPDCECRWAQEAKEAAYRRAKVIQAVWCGPNGWDWSYATIIPHETFQVLEDRDQEPGDPPARYCLGIVFRASDAVNLG